MEYEDKNKPVSGKLKSTMFFAVNNFLYYSSDYTTTMASTSLNVLEP